MKLIFVFLTFVVILLSGFEIWQSEVFRRQGDALLAAGKTNEAIAAFEKAKKFFPLRSDIGGDIAGAKLVAQSKSDYAQIADFVGELQETPELSSLPKVILAPGEVFVPVLMYHHIRVNPEPGNSVWATLNVSPDQLDRQLSYLQTAGFHTVSLDDLTNNLINGTPLPTKPIVLTFDDGYRNFYDTAFPLLKKYRDKAAEFVITGAVDSAPYLTWGQISEMDKSGLIQFGAHTQHHPNLPDLNQSAITSEIVGSKSALESHLGKKITWFAYPYGSYNDFAIKVIKDAGFSGAVSTVYGAVQSREKLYLLPRIMVDGRFTLDNLAARIQQ